MLGLSRLESPIDSLTFGACPGRLQRARRIGPVCRSRLREAVEIPPRTARCDGHEWSGSLCEPLFRPSWVGMGRWSARLVLSQKTGPGAPRPRRQLRRQANYRIRPRDMDGPGTSTAGGRATRNLRRLARSHSRRRLADPTRACPPRETRRILRFAPREKAAAKGAADARIQHRGIRFVSVVGGLILLPSRVGAARRVRAGRRHDHRTVGGRRAGRQVASASTRSARRPRGEGFASAAAASRGHVAAADVHERELRIVGDLTFDGSNTILFSEFASAPSSAARSARARRRSWRPNNSVVFPQGVAVRNGRLRDVRHRPGTSEVIALAASGHAGLRTRRRLHRRLAFDAGGKLLVTDSNDLALGQPGPNAAFRTPRSAAVARPC